MTESAFPFGAPPEPAPDEAPPRRERGLDRRMLLAIVGGVVVLALAAWFLVLPALGGGHTATTPVAAPHARTLSRTPAAAAKTAKRAAAKPAPAPAQPASFDDSVGRDPFKPLIVVTPAAAPATPKPVVAGTGRAPSSSTTSPSRATSTGGTAAAPAPAPAPAPASAPIRFTLDAVHPGATVTVDVHVNGVAYKGIALGQKFAGSQFQLINLAGNRNATFLYGDQGFDVAVGATVQVTPSAIIH